MPTTDPARRLRREAAHGAAVSELSRIVTDTCFPARRGAGQVGLEVEAFAFVLDGSGAPTRRATLREVVAVVDRLADDGLLVANRPEHKTAHPLRAGGWITYEPGGQLEVAPPPGRSVTAATVAVDVAMEVLAGAFATTDMALVSLGADPWFDPALVPQQLAMPRYPAMARAFAEHGPEGALMMRGTCALQVNIDLGPIEEDAERWLLANLVAPLLTATFACSPAAGTETVPGEAVVSHRARAWEHIDDTRTGVPPGFPHATPVDQLVAAAEAADLLFARDAAGQVVDLPRGRGFGAWLDDGDDGRGWPDADDLREHLTTLFHDVRPRGFLEFRSIDAIPARWRSVPATLLRGLLDDPTARQRVRSFLAAHADDLASLRRRAWGGGLREPGLCALAVETWSRGLEGARRGASTLQGRARSDADAEIRLAEAFLDRWTARGRCPADDVVELLGDPAALVAWAREPLPTLAAC